jgi:hypothetical protein
VQLLVTYNRRHFPAASLAPYGIDVQHPDEFLNKLYARTPQEMVQLIHMLAGMLSKTPKPPHDILDAFEQIHITRFAQAIRSHLTWE